MKKLLYLLVFNIVVISTGCDNKNSTIPYSFEKVFGGPNWEEGYSVQQTKDQGYVIAGYSNSFGEIGGDLLLIKTDAHGNTRWIKTFDGIDHDYGRSVRQTTDGGFIVGGYSYYWNGADFSYDIYLVKTDANGDSLWTKTIGGTRNERCLSILQTSDKGYALIGWTDKSPSNLDDIYLVKTNEQGDTLWTKTYGGSGYDTGVSFQQTSDNGYVIAGTTSSYGAGIFDIYLLKIDANGNLQWSKTFGGTEHENGRSIIQTSDGGYLLVGTNYGTGADIYLIKTDQNGDSLWTRTLGPGHAYAVQEDNDGYVISGYTASGQADVYLLKTNFTGDTLWTKTFGGSGSEYGFSLEKTTDGGYVIVGHTSSYGAGYDDIYLIKTDNDGNVDEKL